MAHPALHLPALMARHQLRHSLEMVVPARPPAQGELVAQAPSVEAVILVVEPVVQAPTDQPVIRLVPAEEG